VAILLKWLNCRSSWPARVNLIKLFWHKFTDIFGKLDHFIKANNVYVLCNKICLLKRVKKFASKKFYGILLRNFGVNLLTLFVSYTNSRKWNIIFKLIKRFILKKIDWIYTKTVFRIYSRCFQVKFNWVFFKLL
jgi:hypothetical protein